MRDHKQLVCASSSVHRQHTHVHAHVHICTFAHTPVPYTQVIFVNVVLPGRLPRAICELWVHEPSPPTRVPMENAFLLSFHLCDAFVWCIYVMNLCDAFMWCIHMMYLPDAFMWCICVMHLCDAFMWCIYVMCLCNAFIWCVYEINFHYVFGGEVGAGVETQKNVRGEIGGWGRVPFNSPTPRR